MLNSDLSSRASLPRVVQRSGAHRTRRETLHHLNSALVGGSLGKNEFCRGFVQFCAGHCAPFCSRRPRPLACPGLPVGPPRARATARGFPLFSLPTCLRPPVGELRQASCQLLTATRLLPKLRDTPGRLPTAYQCILSILFILSNSSLALLALFSSFFNLCVLCVFAVLSSYYYCHC